MKDYLTQKEQLSIINDLEKRFLKFWENDFDCSIFLTCRDNFALTKDVYSVHFIKQEIVKKPKFTIAIPVYKRIEELKRALKSALSQNYNDEYEILIVENPNENDNNGIYKMLKEEFNGKVNFYKNESNIGVFNNWNRCLYLAQGDWVCLLHSDDELMSDYLAEMNYFLNKHSNSILIGCVDQIRDVYPPDKCSKYKYRLLYFFEKLFCFRRLIEKKSIRCKNWARYAKYGEAIFLPPNAILHNREKCIKFGGYNQDEEPNGDQVFVNRMKQLGEVVLYRKKILQKKYEMDSHGLTPGCIMQLSFLDPQVFYALISSKKRAKKSAYRQMMHYKRVLQEKKCDILVKYLDDFLKKYGFK
ncbi:glycosyltransferase family 2 protein [Campylobacter coli]|nr:glycosyltransferase family 2 protein [Campylobacter coli]ELU1078638.1 glycosyltransferase family 2 protein [Campylobacter coli]